MAGSSSTPAPQWSSSRAAAVAAYFMLIHAMLSGVINHAPWHALPLRHLTTLANPPSTTAVDGFAAMAAQVQPHGYELQEHFVETADGFILRVFRIPGRKPISASADSVNVCSNDSSVSGAGRTSLQASSLCLSSTSLSGSNSSSTKRPVAFLQHALMDSSAGWLLLGPGRSLALQLVDAGFDVWLGNARGNRYSRNHTTLQPHEPAFWAWSWQQQAEYDLPASISHVLATTQQQKLVLVGYSQGTMTALAALATQPDLAAAVSVGLLLAPAAFTTGMTSPSFVLSSKLGLDTYGLNNGWMEWGSHQPYWGRVCRRVPQLCLHFLTSVCGRNPSGNVDPALIPTIFEHLPAGTSVQVMSHWAQGLRRRDTKHLYAFDYGTNCNATFSHNDTRAADSISSSGSSSNSSNSHSNSEDVESGVWYSSDDNQGWQQHRTHPGSVSSARPTTISCNQQAYGQESPPYYNLAAITTPLALFSGGRDTISTLQDVELLKQQLQPGVLQLHQHLPDYGHLDFELGVDAPDVLYPVMLQLIQKYAGTT